MAGSVDRVAAAAAGRGLAIDIRRMDGSTRTAEEAARQCGCPVGEIVKSLIFRGENSGDLYLFLLGGDATLDLDAAAGLAGEPLARADPRHVRDVTGFAIGGVAPIGHKSPIAAFADERLLQSRRVWAAAGAPDAVFPADPAWLVEAAGARVATLRA